MLDLEPFLDSLNDLGQRLGVDLSRITCIQQGVPHDGDTWPLTSIILPAAIGVLLFLYYKPLGSAKPIGGHQAGDICDSTKPRKMPARPTDGSIRVADILIHPLKSCRGVSLKTCNFSPDGLENDRRYCIIDAKTRTLMTAREIAKMVLITPRIEGDKITVNFPGGSGCPSFIVPLNPTPEDIASWELINNINFFGDKLDGHIVTALHDAFGSPSESLSRYFNKEVYLVYKGPEDRYVEPTFEFPELKATAKYQDGYPILVLSQESMGVVEKEIQSRIGEQGVQEKWREDKVHYRRFRPNIILTGSGPFAEDDWEEIAFGDPFNSKFTLVNKCARCLLPNVSPDTGERDKAVPYKVLMKFRMGLDPKHKMKPCVGSNAVPEREGTVSVGDIVYVKKMIGEAPVPTALAPDESTQTEKLIDL